MATVNLGNIKFKWKGTYNGGSSYTIDDVVEYNGSSYICKLASTGNLPTNATYFEQMSAKGTDGTNGTNGTDLTPTLTTQGDLVYRDGSGLQRLGAGTAGQVLQTGGAGANPSWTTMSSDVVKIAQHDFSVTNANSCIFDDVFDMSTYKNFKLYGEGLQTTLGTLSAGMYAYLRTGGASGTDVTSNYAYVKIGAYREWNAVWSTNNASYSQSTGSAILSNWNGNWSTGTAYYGSVNFDATIQGIGTDKMVNIYSLENSGLSSDVPYLGNQTNHNVLFGTTSGITGIKVYMDSSRTITNGTITLYGLK